jgi:hypothetical protein
MITLTTDFQVGFVAGIVITLIAIGFIILGVWFER